MQFLSNKTQLVIQFLILIKFNVYKIHNKNKLMLFRKNKIINTKKKHTLTKTF